MNEQPLKIKYDTDLKHVGSMVEVVDDAPTHFAPEVFAQLKIVNIPAEDTGGRATIGLVDEVYIDGDSLWPHNVTGTPITSTSTGAMPTPLVSGTTYYIIRISDGICKLATSEANALGGTAIHITAGETGIWTITSVATQRFYTYNNKADTWNHATLI